MLNSSFPRSLRNVDDLFHERGIEVSDETGRIRYQQFGPKLAAEVRKREEPGRNRICAAGSSTQSYSQHGYFGVLLPDEVATLLPTLHKERQKSFGNVIWPFFGQVVATCHGPSADVVRSCSPEPEWIKASLDHALISPEHKQWLG